MKIINIPKRNVRHLVQEQLMYQKKMVNIIHLIAQKLLERNMHETWIGSIDIETFKILKIL